MKNPFAISCWCVAVLLVSCQPAGNSSATRGTESGPTATAPAPVTPTESYPSLTSDIMEKLWNECDYIDFSFYYTDFSMNQNEQNSIRATLRHVASDVPVINPNCQPIGHLFYQSQGKILLDADLFFSQGCTFFIFYENGKKAYANTMTEAGVAFYNNVFKNTQTRQ